MADANDLAKSQARSSPSALAKNIAINGAPACADAPAPVIKTKPRSLDIRRRPGAMEGGRQGTLFRRVLIVKRITACGIEDAYDRPEGMKSLHDC